MDDDDNVIGNNLPVGIPFLPLENLCHVPYLFKTPLLPDSERM